METRATPLPRRWLRRVLLGALDALLCPKHGVGTWKASAAGRMRDGDGLRASHARMGSLGTSEASFDRGVEGFPFRVNRTSTVFFDLEPDSSSLRYHPTHY